MRYLQSNLVAFILIITTSAFAQTDIIEDSTNVSPPEKKIGRQVHASNIYEACRRYFTKSFNNREMIARQSICNGFFFGVGSTLLVLQHQHGADTGMCLPKDLSTTDVARVFLNLHRLYGSKLDNVPPTDALYMGLRKTYPCPELNEDVISIPATP